MQDKKVILKILELFGGLGAIRKAAENLNFKVKTVDYVELDKYPVLAYNKIFTNDYEQQDVCQWNTEIDILCHGSPCQDWSTAGKQDLTKGRSLLYLETLRIIKNLQPKPKYIIWENVLGLLSKKHQPYFQYYLHTLTTYGYTNYWKVLNAKDFGLPQSRKRIFVVSIRTDLKQTFNWDDLETKPMAPLLNFININESNPCYFIKSASMQKAVATGKVRIISEYANTVTTKQDRWNNAGALAVPLKITNYNSGKIKINNLTTFNADNYVTLTDTTQAMIKTLQSNNRCKIAIPLHNQTFNVNGKTNINLNGFVQESYVYESTNPHTTIGTITTNINQSKIAVPLTNEYLEIKDHLEFNKFITLPRTSDGKVINGAYNRFWKTTDQDSYTGTVAASNPPKIVISIANNEQFNILIVPTNDNINVMMPTIKPLPGIPIFIINNKPYHLRVLTELETSLLMGFTKTDFAKIKTLPKTQLYKMFGNSICVPVLEAILKILLPQNIYFKKGETHHGIH